MHKRKTWMYLSIVSGVALVLATLGVWLFAGTSVANAAEMTADDLATITQASTGPGLLDKGYLTHGGWGRRGTGGSIDYQQLLADALLEVLHVGGARGDGFVGGGLGSGAG